MDKEIVKEPQDPKKTNPLKQYHTPVLQHFGFLNKLTKETGYSEEDIFNVTGGGGCGCSSPTPTPPCGCG